MQGGDVGVGKRLPDPRQGGFLQVATTRCAGQKMRFIDHYQKLILIQNRRTEGNGWLVGHLTVVPEPGVGGVRIASASGLPQSIDDVATVQAFLQNVWIHVRETHAQELEQRGPGACRQINTTWRNTMARRKGCLLHHGQTGGRLQKGILNVIGGRMLASTIPFTCPACARAGPAATRWPE